MIEKVIEVKNLKKQYKTIKTTKRGIFSSEKLTKVNVMEKLFQKTVRCYVKNVTEESLEYR